MTKLLLAILFGFMLNTGLRAAYSYSWWSAEATFTNSEMNESFAKYKNYKCVNDKMGAMDLLKYPLITPTYIYRRWGAEYP